MSPSCASDPTRMPAMRRVVWDAGGFGRQSPDLTDERLGGSGRLRAGMQQLGHRHVDCGVQPFDALDDLMHEPDPERAPSIESGAAGEEGRAWLSPILATT